MWSNFDSQESRFQASNFSWKVVVLLIFTNSVFNFQAAKRSDMDCVELQRGLFADCQEWHCKSRNVQIIGVPSCRRVELLMFTNSGFKVRNVEICAVQSSNEVDLQIKASKDQI